MTDKANVLLVDDSRTQLQLLQLALSELDHNVLTAGSGEDALKHVLQHDFAVILLDVQMPGMDGFEAARMIRQGERNEKTPVVFVTGYEGALQQHDGFSVGAADFLFKPVDARILQAKVEFFVELYQSNAELRRQRERLQRELSELDEFSERRDRSKTAEMYLGKPLREQSRDTFRRQVQKFEELLEMALEQRAYRVESQLPARLKSVAHEMGTLRLGPQDVVQVFSEALKNKTEAAPAKMAQVYVEESRLVLIELLGHLVAFYRDRGKMWGTGKESP